MHSAFEYVGYMSGSPTHQWVMFVQQMQHVIKRCGKFHAQSDRCQVQKLQSQLSQLCSLTERGPLSDHDECNMLQCIQKLQNLDAKKATKSRFLYRCEAPKDQSCSLAVLFKQLHHKRNREAMAKTKKEDGIVLYSKEEMLQECIDHFGLILNAPPTKSLINNVAIDTLIQYVDKCVES